jgi:hypothetical protein
MVLGYILETSYCDYDSHFYVVENKERFNEILLPTTFRGRLICDNMKKESMYIHTPERRSTLLRQQ